jgi:hypothetical protein
MQFLANKFNFNFATSAATSDAYSPFARVHILFILSISKISKINEADCSQIVVEFQAGKQNTF